MSNSSTTDRDRYLVPELPFRPVASENVGAIGPSACCDKHSLFTVQNPAENAAIDEILRSLCSRYLANQKALRRIKLRLLFLKARRLVVVRPRRAVLKAKQLCLVALIALLKLSEHFIPKRN